MHHEATRMPRWSTGGLFSGSIAANLNGIALCLGALVLFLLSVGPVVVVSLFVWLVKPSGALSVDSHTAFWLLSSFAVAFSATLGIIVLNWALRLFRRFYSREVFDAVPRHNSEVLRSIRGRFANVETMGVDRSQDL